MSLRVAFYSHNGFGLGHIARNVTLARALLKQRPNADVLIITGSPGVHQAIPPGIDFVKLPAVRKQASARWRPHSLDIDMEHLMKLRRSIILESVRAYRPHLFVADFLPRGVDGELIPALEELSHRTDARTAVGFRDILDEPRVIKETWSRDGTTEALEKLYDLVMVFGEPDWFDFSVYGLRADMPQYVGLLGNPGASPRISSDGMLRLLVTCGGGADGYPILAAALEATEALSSHYRDRLKTTVLTGPLIPETDAERLQAIGKRLGVSVHRFAEDFQMRMARASAVIGMAGYNTVCDVLSYRRPSVLIPRVGPSREQPIRTKILASRGLASNMALAECTGRALATELASLLERDEYPRDALPNLGGVDRAVESLLELVE